MRKRPSFASICGRRNDLDTGGHAGDRRGVVRVGVEEKQEATMRRLGAWFDDAVVVVAVGMQAQLRAAGRAK